MVIFGSVIYQSGMKYLNDFFQSLAQQTNADFRLLLLNADIPKSEMDWIYTRCETIGSGFDIIDCDVNEKIYELRIKLLKEAKSRNASLLIIGDCDDKFDEKRVEMSVLTFEKYQNMCFGYNQLILFDGTRAMSELPEKLDSIDDILQCNMVGLSNSAINLKMLTEEFINSLYEGQTNIFDWYLYSRILLAGMQGRRIDNTCTYYRIHDRNLAGVAEKSKESMLKEYKVKLEHYSILKKYSSKVERMFIRYSEMDIENICLKNRETGFWWDCIYISENGE